MFFRNEYRGGTATQPSSERQFETTLNEAHSRFSTLGTATVPSASRTTKYIWRIGRFDALIVAEKQTGQNGTGVVQNSLLSRAKVNLPKRVWEKLISTA